LLSGNTAALFKAPIIVIVHKNLKARRFTREWYCTERKVNIATWIICTLDSKFLFPSIVNDFVGNENI